MVTRQDPRIGQASPRNATTGTLSAVIVPVNMSRERLVLTNDSTGVVYLAKGGAAVLNAGIRLNANGGTLVDEPDENGAMYTGPWAAVSAAAAVICIHEE